MKLLKYKKLAAGVTGLVFMAGGVGVASSVSADETRAVQAVTVSESAPVSSSEVVSNERLENIGQALENVDATDTTARDMVAELLGGSAQASKELASLVDPSLDVSDDAVVKPSTPAKKLEETLNTDGVGLLPEVNETGEVSIKDVETGAEFSLAPAGAQADMVEDGVAVTRSNVGASVSHVDGELEGQIVTVINDENVNHADFTFDIPVDHHLRYGTDGKLDLVNNQGDTVATVDAPWAVDATGQHLPTYYELIPASNTIRQHVDTKGATYPIAVDPSWWWWVGTATLCAGQLASLFASSGYGLVVKLARLVSKIKKTMNYTSVKTAVILAGGPEAFALVLIKQAYNTLRNKLPSWLKSKVRAPFAIKQVERRAFTLGGWAFGANFFFEAIGLGGCGSLYRALR